MKSVIRASSYFGIIALMLGCGPAQRPENAEYFKKITGINICKNTIVRNYHIDEYEKEQNFTYAVSLRFNRECEIKFIEEFQLISGGKCVRFNSCTLVDSSHNWHQFIRKADGLYIYTFRSS